MRGYKLVLMASACLVSKQTVAHPDRMLLELCINGGCYGAAFVLIRNRHILVDEGALERAHLPVQNMAGQTVGSRRFIDLSSYQRDGKVDLDLAHGNLSMTLPAGAFGRQRVEVNQQRQLLEPVAVPSAFVNYSLEAGTAGNSASAYFDAGFSYGQGLLRDNPSWNQTQGASRGLTRYEYDDIVRLRRWTFGDQYAYSSDNLGGAALLGGVGLVRAFDINPYLITFPQPTLSGLLQAPGTAYIYKNGVLIGTRQVAAGAFSLSSLGIGAGANDVKVVLRDPFGGVITLQQSFYGATQMLAQGLSDYAFQAGLERTSALANGYEGGRAVVLARQSYGFTDSVTAGYRFEAENGLVNTGATLGLRLPLGYIGAGIAASAADGRRAHASSWSYQFNDRYFSFGASLQLYTNGYRKIGDDLLPDSYLLRRVEGLSVGWNPLSRLSFRLTAGDILYLNDDRRRNIGISSMLNIAGGASLSLYVNREIDYAGGADNEAMISMVMPFGRTSVGFNATHDGNGGNSYGLNVQRSVPSDTGWGYSANVEHSPAGVSDIGQLDYQSNYGLAQLSGQRVQGQTERSLLVAGSLVLMDGHVHAGRVLNNGYALVKTDAVPDVMVKRENLPIGSTDSNGDLVVTNLLPYQSNKISIDQNTVPLRDEIDGTDQVISVPRLGGTIVRFGIRSLQAVRGVLTLGGEVVRYGSATLVSDQRQVKTLIGMDGSFYFSNLAVGSYALRARTSSGEMTCRFEVPRLRKPMTDLGKVPCVAGVSP